MKVRSKAPLRLGLAGGGTDLSPYCDIYGGVVLNTTINMYAHCTIEELQENMNIFESVDLDEKYKDVAKSQVEINDKLSLIKGVYNRVIKDFNNGQPLNVKISTYCDAPAGSGLGTSSTVTVAILKAFVEYLKLPLGEYDIANLAYEIERKDLGFAGGKQDQYAATFGGFNFMEFSKDNKVIVNPLRIRTWLINELEASFLLYFTGQSRESANIIKEQILSTENNNSNNLDAMHEMKASAYRMKESLLKGDITGITNELKFGWEAKKRTSKVITNSTIEKAYEVALKAGALAGKVSGAGGGGFMMFIVDPVLKPKVSEALKKINSNGIVMSVDFVEKGTRGWFL